MPERSILKNAKLDTNAKFEELKRKIEAQSVDDLVSALHYLAGRLRTVYASDFKSASERKLYETVKLFQDFHTEDAARIQRQAKNLVASAKSKLTSDEIRAIKEKDFSSDSSIG